ncbi:MAG: uroporphyrinogen-III C-methyltransferase [Gemmatimonadota bacterium]|jgi:uroporphyrinogen III methyltransferase/synthase
MITLRNPEPGTVYLVGGGPGDPGLLTLRGAAALARADVVLYDYLVNPSELEHAPESAELIPLGRPHTGRRFTPEQITDLMIEKAREGRTVVRLKGGDPSVFGRCADETEALREADVPYEIVPGITAGLAVGSYCEIPVTQHADASAVALVTGRERNAKRGSSLDYPSLACFPGTLVFYMGVGRCGEWSRALIEHGKPTSTPVGIVRWCACTDQRFVRCTLDEVPEVVERLDLRPPALFVVGDVVDRAPDLSWFSARPLCGRRVLIPECPAADAGMRDELAALGADVTLRPTARTSAPATWAFVDEALDSMRLWDWIVFADGPSVDRFLGRLLERGGDLRRLGSTRLAALSPGAAERLGNHHLRPDVGPEGAGGGEPEARLVRAARGRSFLLVGDGREPVALGDGLADAGAVVRRLVASCSVDVAEPDAWVADGLAAGEIHWVVATREETARGLVRLYGAALGRARLASLDPTASAVLREAGHEPAVEVCCPSPSSLADALLHAERAGGVPPVTPAVRNAEAVASGGRVGPGASDEVDGRFASNGGKPTEAGASDRRTVSPVPTLR